MTSISNLHINFKSTGQKLNGAIKYSTDLLCERFSIVYQRFSKHEQVKSSRFSLMRQENLRLQAIKDGYRAELTEE